MKTKLFAFILIYIAWNVIVYFCAAFYNLSFSPVDFGEGGRFFFIVAGVFVGIFPASSVFVFDFNENKQS